MSKIIITLPSDEHIAELKEKGIDLIHELSRIVYDNVERVKKGNEVEKIEMEFSKEQIDQLGNLGVDLSGQFARAFKEEFENERQ